MGKTKIVSTIRDAYKTLAAVVIKKKLVQYIERPRFPITSHAARTNMARSDK